MPRAPLTGTLTASGRLSRPAHSRPPGIRNRHSRDITECVRGPRPRAVRVPMVSENSRGVRRACHKPDGRENTVGQSTGRSPGRYRKHVLLPSVIVLCMEWNGRMGGWAGPVSRYAGGCPSGGYRPGCSRSPPAASLARCRTGPHPIQEDLPAPPKHGPDEHSQRVSVRLVRPPAVLSCAGAFSCGRTRRVKVVFDAILVLFSPLDQQVAFI